MTKVHLRVNAAGLAKLPYSQRSQANWAVRQTAFAFGCSSPDELAFEMGWIDAAQLQSLAKKFGKNEN